MATTLTVNSITAGINWNLTNAPTGLQAVSWQGTVSYNPGSLSNGTGATGTANLIYAAQSVIAASGTLSLTFSDGSLTSIFGASQTFARVKYLYINNTNLTTASSITVGNATHPLPLFSAGSTTISINNNGIFFVGDPGASGMAVGSGATDVVKIVNADGANSATVQVVAIGSTA